MALPGFTFLIEEQILAFMQFANYISTVVLAKFDLCKLAFWEK